MKSVKFGPGNSARIIMLLSNAFDADPRVHQEAKALVDSGHEVKMFAWDRLGKSPPVEVKEGIKVRRIQVKSSFSRGSIQILFFLIFWIKIFIWSCKEEFDVIHCHDFDTLLPGILVAKLKRKKIIYDAHESYHDMLLKVPAIIKLTIYYLEKFLIKHVDLLITVGRVLEKRFKKGGAKNTVVIGNWKSIDDFSVSASKIEDARKKFGLQGDVRPIILFIGFLNKSRMLEPLMEAISNNPKFILIVGGRGSIENEIKKFSKRYENIHFTGFVKPDDVPVFTALSDIIYYGLDPQDPNSEYSAPNKLFEAIAAGKALFTSDLGEIGAIVKNFKIGLVLTEMEPVKINGVLNKFLDQDFIDSCQKKSKKLSESTFNWQLASEKLIEQYENITR